MDAESVSLIHSGACGAFVHGLEDEFMGESQLIHLIFVFQIANHFLPVLEVRNAALDSLCQLALSNPRFATLSLDFLVE